MKFFVIIYAAVLATSILSLTKEVVAVPLDNITEVAQAYPGLD